MFPFLEYLILVLLTATYVIAILFLFPEKTQFHFYCTVLHIKKIQIRTSMGSVSHLDITTISLVNILY